MTLNLLPHNAEALSIFLVSPVSRHMINHLARKASEVIQCDDNSPYDRKRSSRGHPPEPPLPSVQDFIYSLVVRSHVHTPTLMTSLVFLAKLKAKLPPMSKGMRCSVHRIFLAALIIAAKNHNDSSPKNKHWARYTVVKGYEGFSFSVSEINLMERQMLFLLDWDMKVTEDDLFEHFEPLLAPIRAMLQAKADRKAFSQKMARTLAASRTSVHSQTSSRGSRYYDSLRLSARPASRAASSPSSRTASRPPSRQATRPTSACPSSYLEAVPALTPEYTDKPGSRGSSQTSSTQGSSNYSPASTISSCTVYGNSDINVTACQSTDKIVSVDRLQVPTGRGNPRPLSLDASVLVSKKNTSKPPSLISRIFGGPKRSIRASYHE
ncbi:hypothetical protein KEM56_005746 [Ascosphaera pollenicola]|nr:hypothetical protein KEM56_005746 [Ascosphaera pollenicola]